MLVQLLIIHASHSEHRGLTCDHEGTRAVVQDVISKPGDPQIVTASQIKERT
jgi:hypothetical protein